MPVFGIIGPQGYDGAGGPPGPQGPTGVIGPTGNSGNFGNDIVITADDTACTAKGHIALAPANLSNSFIFGQKGNGFIATSTPDGASFPPTGGSCRGNNSVDFQRYRSTVNDIALNNQSSILGGSANGVYAIRGCIVAGYNNFSGGSYDSVVISGQSNRAYNQSRNVVVNGQLNHSRSNNSVVIGGNLNRITNTSAPDSVIIGGASNRIIDPHSRAVVISAGNAYSEATDTVVWGGELYLNTVSVNNSLDNVLTTGNGYAFDYKDESAITSDTRLKEDIQILIKDDQNLFDPELLNQIEFIKYVTKSNQKLKFGFSAQNLQTILPHLVDTGPGGYLRINKMGILQYLLSIIVQKEDDMDYLRRNIQLLQSHS